MAAAFPYIAHHGCQFAPDDVDDAEGVEAHGHSTTAHDSPDKAAHPKSKAASHPSLGGHGAGCEQMAKVHDRMPVILRQEAWDIWLNGTPSDAFALCRTWDQDLAVEKTQDRWAGQ